jgi:hypothetical protein
MQQHGASPASFPWRELARRKWKATNPPDPAGFRHFFDPIETNDGVAVRTRDRITVGGTPFNPADSDQWNRAADLMAKLTQLCMVPPIDPTSPENEAVPSGYTYLLQLVAHDIVQSSILLSRANDVYAFANLRDMPLRLQTVYGGGPSECPHVYEPDPVSGFRHRLRLGRMRKSDPDSKGVFELTDKLHDVARGTAGTAFNCKPHEYTEPCIADPRNDSHAIISQMVTAFHMLHNEIDEQLRTVDIADIAIEDRFAAAERRFIATYVACVLIYRAILRNDLLPKVLHPKVLNAYETEPRLTPANESFKDHRWAAPLELTHGVMRFAHAMVRPAYSFNALSPFPMDPSGSDSRTFQIQEILNQNSEHAVARMPFERKWVVDWRRFFGPADRAEMNFSLLISPMVKSGLDLGIQSTDESKILLERDLLSSLAVQPLSVRELIRSLRKQTKFAELLDQSPFLNLNEQADFTQHGDPGWFAPIRDWLTARNDRRGNLWWDPEADGSDDDGRARAKARAQSAIELLAKDPPLPLFTRFEAEQDPASGGKHLGIFGSIIFADVIYNIVQDDSVVGINWKDSLQDQLKNLFDALSFTPVPGPLLGSLGQVNTFSGLVSFLEGKVAFPVNE